MSLPRKLNRDLLVQAVFEIRFASTAPASAILPGLLFASLGALRIERLPAAGLPDELRSIDPNLKFAPVVRLSKENFGVLLSDQSLAVVCDGPYPGWEQFKRKIVDAVHTLAASNIVSSVDRTSLKYSNLGEAELGSVGDCIQLQLNIGPHDAVHSQNFHLRTEISDGSFLHIVQLASHATATRGDGSTRQGFLADVDTIQETHSQPFAEYEQSLPNNLEELHDRNKHIFFGLLRSDFIERLGPHYD